MDLGQQMPANEVTEQEPLPTKKQEESMAHALWRDGHSQGWTKGYRLGYSNGKTTLGHHWFFLTAMFLFLLGGLVGGFMDLITTCGPEIPCGIMLPESWGFAPVVVETPNG